MWAVFWDSLQEVGGRRVVVVLLVLAVVVGLLFNRVVRFGTAAGVAVLYQGAINMGPWPFAVPQILGQVNMVAGTIWLILMVFAGGPQFVAMLEKGWRELTFAKATPRWQILLGRYISLLLLFTVLTVISCAPLALRLWWFTGVSTFSVVGGALIHAFSFGALLAVAALTSLLGQGGVALPVMTPIAGFLLSQFLVNREQVLWDYVTSEFMRRVLDWVYYVVPKSAELQTAAATFVNSSALPSSWPVWTTGVFAGAALTLAMWLLERKSF